MSGPRVSSRPAPIGGPNDRPNNTIDEWLLRHIWLGWRREALIAGGRPIGERTYYRWRAELAGFQEHSIAGWQATYALRHGKPPVRVSDWRPA